MTYSRKSEKIMQDNDMMQIPVAISEEDHEALGENPTPKEILDLIKSKLIGEGESNPEKEALAKRVFNSLLESLDISVASIRLFYEEGDYEGALTAAAQMASVLQDVGRKLTINAIVSGQMPGLESAMVVENPNFGGDKEPELKPNQRGISSPNAYL